MPFFFFFNDTATTEIYTLSLHDALPIYRRAAQGLDRREQGRDGASSRCQRRGHRLEAPTRPCSRRRSEEHTSELQSLAYLVCRLLLEKKKDDSTTARARVDAARTVRRKS